VSSHRLNESARVQNVPHWVRWAPVATVALVGPAIVLGRSDHPWALTALMLACAVPETLAGLWVIRRYRRGPTRWTPQVLFGFALFLLGLARILLNVELAFGSPRFPDPLYVLAHLPAVLAAAGVLRMPRPRREPWQVLRTVVEGLVFASALSFVLDVWWLEGVFGGSLSRTAVTALLIVSSSTWLLGIGFAILVREQEPWVFYLAVVLTLMMAADLLIWRAVWADSAAYPWISNALTIPVWAFAVRGIVATASPPVQETPADRARREHRRSLLFALVVLVLAGLTAVLVTSQPIFSSRRVLDVIIVITALIGRDLLRSAQNTTLLERLSEQGRTDPLTGLGNRLALSEHLTTTLSSEPLHVLTVDLDGFKHVNTQYGLTAGDRVLGEVAGRLAADLGGLGEVFRLGGDEFAVIVAGTDEQAKDAARRIHDSVTGACGALTDLGTMSLSASVGIATCPSADAGDAGSAARSDVLQEAMTRSSHAMMIAKMHGRSRSERYEDEISAKHRRELRLQARLAAVLGSMDEETVPFDVVYQPMVTCGRTLAVEALARWTDPELGEVSAAEFIAAAETAGLIDRLGGRLAEEAVRRFAASGVAGRLGLSLNVSTIQLRNSRFADTLTAVVHRHGLDPATVLLEVTESVFVHPLDPAVPTLHALKANGFAIAVDDFGAGYSSLGYLGRLPVDVIKIDASLTRHLHETRASAIVRAVLEMASTLQLGVVAEGIADKDQLFAAVRLGVPVAQGFITGRPVPPDELAGLVSDSARVDTPSGGEGLNDGDDTDAPQPSRWRSFVPG
jgi:diguanylate cyclase (GGDEF)-like protein